MSRALASLAIGSVLLAAAQASAQSESCPECWNPPPEAPQHLAPPPPPLPWTPPQLVLDPVATLLIGADLGPVYSRTLQRNFGGARIDLQIGADLRDFTVSGRFGLEGGSTQSGLGYERIQWGLGVDRKIGDRVRLGVEGRFGMLIIDRVSDTSDPLIGFTAGAHGELMIALISPGRRPVRTNPALDLVIRAGYDWIDVSNGSAIASSSFSGKIGIGGRY